MNVKFIDAETLKSAFKEFKSLSFHSLLSLGNSLSNYIFCIPLIYGHSQILNYNIEMKELLIILIIIFHY